MRGIIFSFRLTSLVFTPFLRYDYKMDEFKRISIIIPNFNGEKYIKPCLDSLMGQCDDAIEIIVVDDCSSDDSMAVLSDYKNVRVLQNEVNSGFAASVNRGIRESNGEFLLLLNNDVVVASDFVAALYRAIQKDERRFAISSRMVRFNERDKLDDTGDFYNILGWAFKRGDGNPISQYHKPTKVFSVCAGAALYRKSVFDEIGLFDERFFAYLEDVDVSYRALIHGYENWYEPTAICYHIGSATTADGNKYSPFKVRISARNNIYLVYKNMPIGQLLLNFPFLFCGFTAKAAMFATRGYGREYICGLVDGLKGAKSLKKSPFKAKRTLNYLKIELMLIDGLLKQLETKSRR